MTDLLLDPNTWLSFATLAALEIVLGIDNLLFLNIVAERVAPERRDQARKFGLAAALLTRLALLFSLSWVMSLTRPLFEIAGFALSARDLILVGGGLFLMAKGTIEIHHAVDPVAQEDAKASPTYMAFGMAILQIAILDIVFSLDSVITAIGMADRVSIMVAAVVAAMLVMLLAAGAVGRFIAAHASVKMLALSFLLLIGVALIADGLHLHIPKGYLYFSIAFSAGVEALNIWARRRRSRSRPV